MCGRFVSSAGLAELVEEYGVAEVATEALPPRYNVAPTDLVYAVVGRRAGPSGLALRRLGSLRWGLVPSWAKNTSGAARMINARAEGIATKPAFRVALHRRRCVLPADAF